MEISQCRSCSFFATAANGAQGNLLRRRANAALTAMSENAAFWNGDAALGKISYGKHY